MTLGALLRVPYAALVERTYAALADASYPDVRPAHSAVFRHILPGGSRVVDLAERAQITKQSMGYLVEHLRAAGYVTLEPDPDDGRAKRVRLTARGEEVVETLVTISGRIEREIAAEIGEDALATLRELLARLQTVTALCASPPEAHRV